MENLSLLVAIIYYIIWFILHTLAYYLFVPLYLLTHESMANFFLYVCCIYIAKATFASMQCYLTSRFQYMHHECILAEVVVFCAVYDHLDCYITVIDSCNSQFPLGFLAL